MDKAIILASGVGSRLMPLTRRLPKSLMPVINGTPNICNTIKALAHNKSHISEVIIITNPSSVDDIVSSITKESLGIEYKVITTPHPSTYNNCYTLYEALSHEDFSDIDGFFIVEGDIVIKDYSVFDPVDSSHSWFMTSPRENEWKVVTNEYDGRVIEVLPNNSGECLSGVSYINNENCIDYLGMMKDADTDISSWYWEEIFMNCQGILGEFRCKSYTNKYSIEYDSLSDILDNNLMTYDEIAQVISDKDYVPSRLSSMTNINYLIKIDGSLKVLRLPGVGTDKLVIHHSEENYISEKASLLELGPESTYYHYPNNKEIKISDYLEGYTTASELSFPELVTTIFTNILANIEVFHSIPHKFEDSEFKVPFINLEQEVYLYKSIIANSGKPMPILADYQLLSIIHNESHHDIVLCHRDLVLQNIMYHDHNIKLIDYEYSGLLNKYWDYGGLLSEISYHYNLDESATDQLLSLMIDINPELDKDKVISWYHIVNYVWGLWGYAKTALGEDYSEYGRDRLVRSGIVIS